MIENRKRPLAWMHNIFCCFENEPLKKAVEEWANNNSCTITWADENCDIMHVPFFVGIVDRSMLGKEEWEFYLNIVANISEEVYFTPDEFIAWEDIADSSIIDPLIIIDTRKGFRGSDQSHFYRCDPTDIDSILKIVSTAYERALDYYDKLFRENNLTLSFASQDLLLKYGTAVLALVSLLKKRWREGERIPVIGHGKCKGVNVQKLEWVYPEKPESPEYGPLIISGDQKVENSIDLITCRCEKCGKELQISSGHLEALLSVFDRDRYLDEIDQAGVFEFKVDEGEILFSMMRIDPPFPWERRRKKK